MSIQPQQYLVEAFWQNSVSRTHLFVRCTTHPEAVCRAEALVEEGHRECQTGAVDAWNRVTIRPCTGTPTLRDVSWPGGQ
jgi:hypothetical protein